MKNKKNLLLLLLVVGCIAIVGGVTYAFFNYSKTSTTNSELVTGDIYFNFTNESNGITLTNTFPETVEEARARTDNTFTFDITGRNTSNKPIYYEIDIVDGDVPSGKTESNRILPEYLRFDLMEGETLVANNVNYSELLEQKIWVNTIDEETSSNITRNYTLRMWIDEDLLISDTDSEATYTTGAYKSLFASIKVKVVGDFNERTLTPSVYYAFSNVDEYNDEDWFPSDTDIMTLPDITNDYTTLEHNTFIKFEGPEKSVCAIIKGNLECFKNNNYENEKAHLQSIFDEENCYEDSPNFYCDDDAWSCGGDSNGYVACYVSSTGNVCELFGEGFFGCSDHSADDDCELGGDGECDDYSTNDPVY